MDTGKYVDFGVWYRRRTDTETLPSVARFRPLGEPFGPRLLSLHGRLDRARRVAPNFWAAVKLREARRHEQKGLEKFHAAAEPVRRTSAAESAVTAKRIV
jgi:hypothetical protein